MAEASMAEVAASMAEAVFTADAAFMVAVLPGEAAELVSAERVFVVVVEPDTDRA
jgi:hypothetical protein